MAQQLINLFQVKQELVNFLRNQDIMSTSERGVTTAQDIGDFSSETEYLINQPNIKNIRNIIVDAVSLKYGRDYNVDFTFDDSGIIKTKITFTSPQTGVYTIDYDFGSDKIWPDYPRDDLKINSYPRIAADVLGIDTKEFGIGGNELISDIMLSVTVFGQGINRINSLLTLIRKRMLENRKTFFYFKFTGQPAVGPLIEDPNKRQEIMRQNIDFTSLFNVETIT